MKQRTTGNNLESVEVIATGLAFPEGPAFAADGSLWLVELKAGNLVRCLNSVLERFHVGGAPNGIAIHRNGDIWFCDAGRKEVRQFIPSTGETKKLASQVDGHELHQPNDLAFDKQGTLLFTCPGESRRTPDGYVCALMKDGNVKKIATGKYFPNGLAFTQDGSELVIAETYRHRLWKGDWNTDTCEWTNERPWCNIGGPDGPGGPDGMAFDTTGNVYAAVYGTGSVRVADPQGAVFDVMALPGTNPTNCAFDPKGNLGLVVTEAEKGMLLSIKVKNNGMQLFAGK